MDTGLFIFAVRAVATESTKFRAGARHALMLYATGIDVVSARSVAISGAERGGWSFVEVHRAKEIDADPALIEDDVLRSAAYEALTGGSSLVVYSNEIAPDA